MTEHKLPSFAKFYLAWGTAALLFCVVFGVLASWLIPPLWEAILQGIGEVKEVLENNQ